MTQIDSVNSLLRKWKERQRHQRIKKTIEKVRSRGGVNSSMFWEVIRDLKPKKTEEKTPVIDMKGNRIEERDQIGGGQGKKNRFPSFYHIL